MLVKLYALPDLAPALAGLKTKGVEIRRAHPGEKHQIAEWVREHIHPNWGNGCEIALEQRPPTLYVAVEKDPAHIPTADPYNSPSEILLGFACYDVVARGVFGPIGVREERRDCGIGTALLLTCLHAMAAERYAYAVIGWAGPIEWYARTVGATIIEGSEPGIFRGSLK
ncbi:GNAT family N-acetyltransferase [Microcoleus sp. K1-B6]